MDIFDLKQNSFSSVIPQCPVIALGNFDGVHSGHSFLIEKAVSKAKELNTRCAVFTFKTNPHSENNKNFLLTDNNEKCRIFKDLGVDFVFFENFEDVKELSPEEFVYDVLVKKFDCPLAFCGFNFHFGNKGSGNADRLLQLMKSQNRQAVIIPEITVDGTCVSSTTIRAFVENGEIEKANRLLGRPFSVFSHTQHGKGLGKTLGFPTVNQEFPPDTVIPQSGVYVSKTSIDGKEYSSISNIGSRPTFGGKCINIETFIFDFSENLYNKSPRVSLYKKIRNEIKFNSEKELQQAVEKDISEAKKYFQKKG